MANHTSKPSVAVETVYTLVTPIEDQPGKFRRRIVSGITLRKMIAGYIQHGSSVRFYVEPHNGVDNEAIIGNWPEGVYS